MDELTHYAPLPFTDDGFLKAIRNNVMHTVGVQSELLLMGTPNGTSVQHSKDVNYTVHFLDDRGRVAERVNYCCKNHTPKDILIALKEGTFCRGVAVKRYDPNILSRTLNEEIILKILKEDGLNRNLLGGFY